MYNKGCVNALQRALSISTNLKRNVRIVKKMCQCPQLGSFHFYKDLALCIKEVLIVSMPFNGLSPFLQTRNLFFRITYGLCQCPLTGSLHFYLKDKNGNLIWENDVSMPLVGLSPFLRIHYSKNFVWKDVSMPFNGLFPFLSSLLGTP